MRESAELEEGRVELSAPNEKADNQVEALGAKQARGFLSESATCTPVSHSLAR